MEKRITDGWKTLICIFLLGAVITSCEKDETIIQNDEQVSEDLQEPPFENYLVISDEDAGSKKAAEIYLKSVKGISIVRSMPEIGVTVVNTNDLNLLQKAASSNLTIIPDYEIQWIPSQTENELISLDVSAEALSPSPGDTEGAYIRLWGMDAIDAPEAWNAGFTGKGASVFVLDSGIDRDNVEFSQTLNRDLSASFVPGETYYTRPGRFTNHGTHVAGTINANKNNFGVIGVAYEAELVAVKVLSEFTGSGAFSSINAGIMHAADNDADVVNMSLGATFQKNGTITDADGNEFHIPAVNVQVIIQAQQRAINYAYSKGVTIIASAGNDPVNYDGNSSYIKLPGGLNNVITISATAPEGWHPFTNPNTNFDIPTSYTTHGRSLVDFAAPGGDADVSQLDMIFSVASGVDAFNYNLGTSMAAPHASGVAALIIAKNGGKMDPHSVEKQMIRSADQPDGNGKSLFFGKGRVNAFRAVKE